MTHGVNQDSTWKTKPLPGVEYHQRPPIPQAYPTGEIPGAYVVQAPCDFERDQHRRALKSSIALLQDKLEKMIAELKELERENS